MQHQGITDPPTGVKAATRALVEKLSTMDPGEEIAVFYAGSLLARYIRASTGEVLAEIHDESRARMTRAQVIARLELCRNVGAKVQGSAQVNSGFVFVRPEVDTSRAELIQRDALAEPELRRTVPNSNVVACYHIEYTELRPGWEVEPDDWDRYLYGRERVVCESLARLEQVLAERWGLALENLQLPSDVDHPF
jgi:hypothetical protein